jgi:hypothetical protein
MQIAETNQLGYVPPCFYSIHLIRENRDSEKEAVPYKKLCPFGILITQAPDYQQNIIL